MGSSVQQPLLAPTDAHHHPALGCCPKLFPCQSPLGLRVQLASLFAQREPAGAFSPAAMGQVRDGESDMATLAAEPPIPPSHGQLHLLGWPPNPPAALARSWPQHCGSQVQAEQGSRQEAGRKQAGSRQVVSSICWQASTAAAAALSCCSCSALPGCGALQRRAGQGRAAVSPAAILRSKLQQKQRW